MTGLIDFTEQERDTSTAMRGRDGSGTSTASVSTGNWYLWTGRLWGRCSKFDCSLNLSFSIGHKAQLKEGGGAGWKVSAFFWLTWCCPLAMMMETSDEVPIFWLSFFALYWTLLKAQCNLYLTKKNYLDPEHGANIVFLLLPCYPFLSSTHFK